MLDHIYENAKNVLSNEKDMIGVKNIYRNKEYKPYFQRYIYKYFVSNPKKNDSRNDFNEFYRKIRDKSMLNNLISCFDREYDACLKNIEKDELHDWQVEDLEKRIAETEIAINKIISIQSPLSDEFKCHKDETIKYLQIRDEMIEKVNLLNNKTVEYYRMMWD
ncbi:hypothetical protein Ccar_16100 [Clostridium carboxidivorans P7]|uniref:Uncharacterized protein n=1 Tax=Clostridium carboxidivorans P7 TaxID=536227 RepID=C6Q2F8_9CLOT|nr:hypothetical protein [Clostridium carboxidivorans]AKN32303.1 hypothetical protein Ccar_16100 [Clostridium carboxidivorans P7]EET84322.1 hypothetical protein CcarbDRAFT_5226 [Clostridium carboxidivorans P7]